MKKWEFRKKPAGDIPVEWAENLNISNKLLEIFWKRGFSTEKNINDFLSAKLGFLSQPENCPQIPKAAELMVSEILKGKKIAVWGDYDVDGITATAVALDILNEHGIEAAYHLPDRRSEGYGLNISGIEKLAAEGCQVLYTVDCGISNIEAVKRAKELGFTVIISDHHLPPEELPEAHAIVNPRMEVDGKWVCPHLAGVGVSFFLMGAVNARLAAHTGKRYKMDRALDLVALGTLADIMKVEGENRILVRGGLEHLTNTRRPGMAALKIESGFDMSSSLTSGQVVFRLAPRINAAGRMGHPDLALNLLRARNFTEAKPLAKELEDFNNLRKKEEERIYKEAKIQAEELLEKKDYSGLALYGRDWHPGIIGIVASRIVEDFNRPTIILCEDNNALKGSGRSVPDFDLYKSLEATKDLLLGFGGHKQAAGLKLIPGNLDSFRDAFSKAVIEQIGSEPKLPVLQIDAQLSFAEATSYGFLEELQLMQPFGPGNPEPVFVSPPLIVKRRSWLGHDRKHVLLELEDTQSNTTLSCKAWRMADELPESLVNKQIVIAYTPKIDYYKGLPSIDIGLKDWRKV